MAKRLFLGAFVTLLLIVSLPALAGSLFFQEPDPETHTVPSRELGEDYKDDPAPPEIVIPSGTDALSAAQQEAIYKSVDPNDSPYVRVCVNDDGSGRAQFIVPPDRPSPAEEAPPPPGEAEQVMELIPDKRSCSE